MLKIVTFLLGCLLASTAWAQTPDPQKVANIERQYLEQELAQMSRDKARIVALSVIERENNVLTVKKLCDLVEEGKRPEECKK